ncbi:hypothetical protein LOD99_5030 [Oopsacas minuta]|uniref:Uncharacterized protein n=1 Tax=Oopsacas minuta TaxID=111878 RepID=A0AAV7JSC2_9METZ|nr:hypothetical protein LOD99_5030 [Oopsacas minuta]
MLLYSTVDPLIGGNFICFCSTYRSTSIIGAETKKNGKFRIESSKASKRSSNSSESNIEKKCKPFDGEIRRRVRSKSRDRTERCERQARKIYNGDENRRNAGQHLYIDEQNDRTIPMREKYYDDIFTGKGNTVTGTIIASPLRIYKQDTVVVQQKLRFATGLNACQY